ncbi:MAG: hypothetical protein RTU30_13525 [Candidatus Thorarchaeota archaeon]
MNTNGKLIALGLLMLMSGVLMLVTPLSSTQQSDVVDNFFMMSSVPSNYSTLLGGSSIEEEPILVFDEEGNLIVAGQTISSDLPTTEDAYQNETGGNRDGFIAKFDPDGTLIFLTYLGGSDRDQMEDVTVDAEGNIIVVGCTDSDDFPVYNGYQETFGGDRDAFIAKLTPNGSNLIFSTFFGGSVQDWFYSVTLDSEANILFGGVSASDGLATSGSYQTTRNPGRDILVGKMAANGSAILWVTYLGGSVGDVCYNIDVDSNDDVVLCGATLSDDMPLENPYQDTFGGGQEDAVVAKFSADGSNLIFCTLMGGNQSERMSSIVVDSSDDIIVGGYTTSFDFPVYNAYQEIHTGDIFGTVDMTLAKFNGTGSLEYSTYFGGEGNDQLWSLVLDASDNILAAGKTPSDDFPVTAYALQETLAGDMDAFALNFSNDGQTLFYSTYLGGVNADAAENIAISETGVSAIAGYTDSDDFPVTNGSYQTEVVGSTDIFITWNPYVTLTPVVTSTTTSSETTTTTQTSTTTTISTTPSSPSTPIDLTIPIVILVTVGLVVVVIVVAKKR